jgi:hypothetical protein|tara:strand:- start:1268 stop:1516 length:249 start_codon:yes stop_codon:yes gene_type:complete
MNILENEKFYCCFCNKKYTEKPTDKGSEYYKNYCKFLGYCKKDCWDKNSKSEKWELSHYAYLNGDIIKRHHKWYMDNIPNWR